MKGSSQVIATLQAAMAAEAHLNLQYRHDWRSAKNLGAGKIAKKLKEFGHDTHQWLRDVTDHLMFLEGSTAYAIPGIEDPATLTAMFENELKLEMAALGPYEQAIQIAMEALDDDTRNKFEHLIKWHHGHVLWLERQIKLIDGFGQDTGEARYLAEKL